MKPNWLKDMSETIMFNFYVLAIGLSILYNQYRAAMFFFAGGVLHALWTIVENTKKK